MDQITGDELAVSWMLSVLPWFAAKQVLVISCNLEVIERDPD